MTTERETAMQSLQACLESILDELSNAKPLAEVLSEMPDVQLQNLGQAAFIAAGVSAEVVASIKKGARW